MEELGFLGRLGLSFTLPWRVLFDGEAAARVSGALSHAPQITEVAPEAAPAERDLSPALQMLAILQREGRLVDFLEEDISSFSDADVGAAARVVHSGCKKALADYVSVEPLRAEAEGDTVRVEAGFDPVEVQLTGNVVGEPPFSGRLAHHGWRAKKVRLPSVSGDPNVVAPAEVEL